ncbi:MAG: histidine kinase [Acidimicrobiales bacterium]
MSIREEIADTWKLVGPRTRDAIFILLAFCAGLAETLTRARADKSYGWVLAFSLVGVVVLWWRRSRPVGVTLAGLAVLAVTSLPVTAMVGLFTLAVRRRDRALIAVSLASVVVFGYDNTVNGDPGRHGGWAGGVISGILVVGFVVAAGAYVGARRDLVASLRDRAERAEQEREIRAEQARLGERTRIAREMHDVLAHKVTLIALHAGALEVGAADDPAQVRRTAELIRTTSREAMEDPQVLGVLRSDAATAPPDLRPPPTTADIVRLVDESRAAGAATELVLAVEEPPSPVARAVCRVVQEGLTNAHKHAPGAASRVSVTGSAERGVTVEVSNRRSLAVGALLPGSGIGLDGLRERVGLLGGTLGAGPDEGGGWRLVAWLPWPPDGQEAP